VVAQYTLVVQPPACVLLTFVVLQGGSLRDLNTILTTGLSCPTHHGVQLLTLCACTAHLVISSLSELSYDIDRYVLMGYLFMAKHWLLLLGAASSQASDRVTMIA
jgi:hypothetical protein